MPSASLISPPQWLLFFNWKMLECLNFFSDSVNKDTTFSIKVLGWLFLIHRQENQFIWAKLPFHSETHLSLHWPCPIIISFPFWLRWLLQTSFLCFENLAKINFVISVSIIPWLFSGSLTCWQLWSFGGYSTDLPTYFHWHQFSFIHALFCTEYSLNKHACSRFAVGLLEE